MKRLCVAVTGFLAVASAWGQGTRVWTAPTIPATEVLDRFNLRLGWRVGLHDYDLVTDGVALSDDRLT